MDIVCFGQGNWRDTWTGKQQLMSRMARRGHRVLYVDPRWSRAPTGDLRALRPVRNRYGLEEVEPRLHVLTYHYAPLLRRINEWRWPWIVRWTARDLGMTDPVALVLRPFAAPLVRRLDPPTLVYYAVDEHTGFEKSPERKAKRRELEEELLRRSDLALAVSERLRRRFEEIQRHTVRLPNGSDVESFSPEVLSRAPRNPEVRDLPGPRIGFIGRIDQRMDQDLLLDVARRRPRWSFVLVGSVRPGVEVSDLRAQSNVHLLGYQEHDRLPGIIRDLDVCTVPYRLTSLTQSCDPLKVREYLAAGKPVVATPLEGLRWCRDVIHTVRTADEFILATEAALLDPEEERSRRLDRARRNTWDDRTEELERLLEQAAAWSARHDGQGTAPWFPGPERDAVKGDAVKGNGSNVPRRLEEAVVEGPAFPGLALRRFRESAFGPGRRWLYRLSRVAGWIYYGVRILARAVTGSRPLRVRKILLPRGGRLGDQVLYLPMLHAMRAAYPDARITLAIRPDAPLTRLRGSIPEWVETRTIPDPARLGRLGRLGLYGRLFGSGYDLVVSGGAFSLMPEALLSGAPRLVGLWDGHPLQTLNTRMMPVDPEVHETDNNLMLARARGGELSEAARVPRVRIEDREGRDEDLSVSRELGLPDRGPMVMFHPGASKPSRRWPARHFATLAEELLRERSDLRIVLSGTEDEAPLADEILGQLSRDLRDRVHDAFGRTTLRSLVTLMDRCDLLIANDTGVMHLARARGVPLVALLGPENPQRWGPYPVGDAPAVAVRNAVPCAPCKRRACRFHVCMRGLDPEEVLVEARRILDGEVPGTSNSFEGNGKRTLPTLERRERTRSWSELQRAGLEIPEVTVVLVRSPAEGGGAGDDVDGVDEALLGRARRLAGSRGSAEGYPNLDLLVVTTDPDLRGPTVASELEPGGRECDGSRIRELSMPAPRDARELWSRILPQTQATFVVPLFLEAPWPESALGSLGAQVAALVREPTLSFAYTAEEKGPEAVDGDRSVSPGALTVFRRRALEDYLVFPSRDPGRGGAGAPRWPEPFGTALERGLGVPVDRPMCLTTDSSVPRRSGVRAVPSSVPGG